MHINKNTMAAVYTLTVNPASYFTTASQTCVYSAEIKKHNNADNVTVINCLFVYIKIKNLA